MNGVRPRDAKSESESASDDEFATLRCRCTCSVPMICLVHCLATTNFDDREPNNRLPEELAFAVSAPAAGWPELAAEGGACGEGSIRERGELTTEGDGSLFGWEQCVMYCDSRCAWSTEKARSGNSEA